MVGAGIFSLTARFGAATGSFGTIFAWIIAGGMLMLAFAFDHDKFAASFWGGGDYSGSRVFQQVRSTMLVTDFVFIGIEGASVCSRYAKTREDVGRATVVGFLGVLCLLVLVTLLPYGGLAAVLSIMLSLWRKWLRMPKERWQVTHGILAIEVIAAGVEPMSVRSWPSRSPQTSRIQ